MPIHTEDKPYVCKVCNMRYTSKNQLFKHLRAGGECSRLTGDGGQPTGACICTRICVLTCSVHVHVYCALYIVYVHVHVHVHVHVRA